MSSVHLEIINLVWAVVSGWLVFIMARYVVINFRDGGWAKQSVQLAKGLAILFLGEGAIRAWIWWARAASRDGASTAWMFTSNYLVLFALVAVTGGVCVARVVSPQSWGHARWAIPVGLASIMTLWSLWGVQG